MMSTDSVDISQLSGTQQEALQTYTSITDQDPVSAIPILRRAEWNVQIAVTRFFEGEPTSDPVAEAQASIPAPSTRQTANLQYESLITESNSLHRATTADTVQAVDTTSAFVPQYQPGLLLSIRFTPFNILYRVFSTIFSPFSFLVPPFLSRLIGNLVTAPRPNRRPLPPAENAHRFIREFTETYSSEQTLPWVESGFNLALDNAKKSQKFLLVVLLSPSHDDTTSYVRETLLSSTFTAFLSSHRPDLILWGGNVQDSEAYQVSNNLNCTKFPFAALVCQTPSSSAGTSANGGNMTVVLRAVGPMSASELTAKLGTTMTAHQAALRAARAQQAEQHASRTLREEQDSAYERSLAQDRERARKRKEEEEAKRRAEETRRRQVEAAEQLAKQRDQWRRWKAKQIAPEPGQEVKDAIRVSIRMTDGQRIIRKFAADAAMEELYAYVECHDVLEGQQDNSSNADAPAGYEHEYKFRLVSPMPRTVYDLPEGGTIGARVGRSANLIVELVDDEDEDDNDEDDIDEKAGAGPSAIASSSS